MLFLILQGPARHYSQSNCYITADLHCSFRTSQHPPSYPQLFSRSTTTAPSPLPQSITQIFPSFYLFSSSPLLSVSSQFIEKHFTRTGHSDTPNQDPGRIAHYTTDIHHTLLRPKRAAESKGKNIHPRPGISTQNYSLYNPDA